MYCIGQVPNYRRNAVEILNNYVIGNDNYSTNLRISRGLEL